MARSREFKSNCTASISIPTIRQTIAAEIARKTTTEKPANATHWSTRTLAAEVGTSPATVQRVWKANGLQPHRTKTFKLSNDKKFAEKLIDVVGLYLNPPDHAIVLCVDEKSQIQALDRTQKGFPSGTARRRAFRSPASRRSAGIPAATARRRSRRSAAVRCDARADRDACPTSDPAASVLRPAVPSRTEPLVACPDVALLPTPQSASTPARSAIAPTVPTPRLEPQVRGNEGTAEGIDRRP